MLSRSTCIVTLIVFCGQILLTGVMLIPLLTPLHPAWLLQDRLMTRIDEAAHRPWPFTSSCRTPRQRKRRRRRRDPGRSISRGAIVIIEVVWWLAGLDPPTDLMDQVACQQEIQQARREPGVVCPHCDSSQVKRLAGQLTAAGWQRYACQVCRTPKGYLKTFSVPPGPSEANGLSDQRPGPARHPSVG